MSALRHAPIDLSISILRDSGIDLIAPGQDAAGHVFHLLEAGFAQKIAGFAAADAAFAVGYQLHRGIQFVYSFGEFAEWD